MENIILSLGLISAIILWLWALIDLAFSGFKKSRWKTGWLLVIIFFPIMGSILYLLLKEDFKLKRKRKFNPDFNKSRTL